uniref:Uncharacterized protein n=1 Tax=Picea glauca TaxID=3330 RepID=A0A101M1Q2_PICGL|nr:hypothetical protein ABT39_MTgene3863 [Picea glauca]QHR86136.1 hypothetical protein Q903MT_gene135 [Picea sitchensis]
MTMQKPSTIRMAFIQQLAWDLFTLRNPSASIPVKTDPFSLVFR